MIHSRPSAAQRGFTLVELLISMILMAVFGLVLVGFFTASSNQATTHQSQAIAQEDARSATELMSRELRQAIMPDPTGTMPPVESLTPTSITFHIDTRRTPGNLGGVLPRKVRYRLVGTDLVRDIAQPIGSSPPFSFTGYAGATVIAANVTNGASAIFSGFSDSGATLASSLNSTQTDALALIHIDLRLAYKTGNSDKVFQVTTDVAPRNPRSAA
ncbi:MAG: prepilin-type N-terminal cleavage/methylation domain-containing protein [Thermoleophilia bacterium]